LRIRGQLQGSPEDYEGKKIKVYLNSELNIKTIKPDKRIIRLDFFILRKAEAFVELENN
jgi:hypothetical protein